MKLISPNIFLISLLLSGCNVFNKAIPNDTVVNLPESIFIKAQENKVAIEALAFDSDNNQIFAVASNNHDALEDRELGEKYGSVWMANKKSGEFSQVYSGPDILKPLDIAYSPYNGKIYVCSCDGTSGALESYKLSEFNIKKQHLELNRVIKLDNSGPSANIKQNRYTGCTKLLALNNKILVLGSLVSPSSSSKEDLDAKNNNPVIKALYLNSKYNAVSSWATHHEIFGNYRLEQRSILINKIYGWAKSKDSIFVFFSSADLESKDIHISKVKLSAVDAINYIVKPNGIKTVERTITPVINATGVKTDEVIDIEPVNSDAFSFIGIAKNPASTAVAGDNGTTVKQCYTFNIAGGTEGYNSFARIGRFLAANKANSSTSNTTLPYCPGILTISSHRLMYVIFYDVQLNHIRMNAEVMPIM